MGLLGFILILLLLSGYLSFLRGVPSTWRGGDGVMPLWFCRGSVIAGIGIPLVLGLLAWLL